MTLRNHIDDHVGIIASAMAHPDFMSEMLIQLQTLAEEESARGAPIDFKDLTKDETDEVWACVKARRQDKSDAYWSGACSA